MSRLRPHMRVPLVVAEERALSVLDQLRPLNAATVANAIWPEHTMRAQGAGAAASRILKGLQKRGLADWIVVRRQRRAVAWGWVRI